MEVPPAAGRLLVSSPALQDPNFARSLVLLLDVDGDGALGVILNRPSETDVGDVLAPWGHLVEAPGVLFRGGPVDAEAALALAQVASRGEAPLGWRQVFGRTGVVDLDTPVALVKSEYAAIRIYAGYSGWAAGQLEAEIAEGAWYVVHAAPEDLFSPDPDGLWRRVLGRQPGRMSLMATMPADVGMN